MFILSRVFPLVEVFCEGGFLKPLLILVMLPFSLLESEARELRSLSFLGDWAPFDERPPKGLVLSSCDLLLE